MTESSAAPEKHNPGEGTPRNLEEMKAFLLGLGIPEGSPEYASMMKEAIASFNSPGLDILKTNNSSAYTDLADDDQEEEI